MEAVQTIQPQEHQIVELWLARTHLQVLQLTLHVILLRQDAKLQVQDAWQLKGYAHHIKEQLLLVQVSSERMEIAKEQEQLWDHVLQNYAQMHQLLLIRMLHVLPFKRVALQLELVAF